MDYLPVSARQKPVNPRTRLVDIINGEAQISEDKLGTNWASFRVSAESRVTVRLNIFKFPHWKTFIDGREVENFVGRRDRCWSRQIE